MVRLKDVRRCISVPLNKANLLVLVPGAMCLAMGLVMVFVPRLLYFALAAFFILTGIALLACGRRLQKLLEKIRLSANDFEAKVYIHGLRGGNSEHTAGNNPSVDQKKIVYH
jgi:hypothetical protein